MFVHVSKQVHPEVYKQILNAQKVDKEIRPITKQIILDASLRLIVNEALPLSKIESPHWWNFVHSEFFIHL